MSKVGSFLSGALLAGAGVAWWGYRFGARDFRLINQQVPGFDLHSDADTGADLGFKILHLSDLHLGRHNPATAQWLASLAQIEPDLVVVTGDSLSGRDSVGPVLDALEPFFVYPGVMVGGSHDYYEPRVINPLKYLDEPSTKTDNSPEMPWRNLRDAVRLAGWHWLENSAIRLSTPAGSIDVVGVDDAHFGRDDTTKALDALTELGDKPRLVLGVTHSPYLRVLDSLAGGGAKLILAGHTHGGQIRLPKFGSLVTNCDLPNQYSRGLSRFGDVWLHVSAGLGTSPFAPIRLGCPPEATLIELTQTPSPA